MAQGSRATRLVLTLISLSLVTAACSATQSSDEPSTAQGPLSEISIPNEGGEGEGHTPIGFAGMGTGLFAGDNLNSRFPDGDGVQKFLTFSLSEPVTAGSATLHSDLLQTQGTPFDDLGVLTAERVQYDEFGPHLFDLPASGEPSSCIVVGGTAVNCDVTGAVQAAIDEGSASVQFRLRFERVADNDGQADLAMFYRSDSNTNESGLFTLVVSG
jgi:hypothetical protein